MIFVESPCVLTSIAVPNPQDWQHEQHGRLIHISYIIEGSLEVKLPTIWRDEKQSREEAERRERLEERSEEEKDSEERRCRCAKR